MLSVDKISNNLVKLVDVGKNKAGRPNGKIKPNDERAQIIDLKDQIYFF